MAAYTTAWRDLFFDGHNGPEIADRMFGGDKRAAKAFYTANADAIEANCSPGSRSELYWWAVSAEPRDTGTPEELQLLRMGELTDRELGVVADRIRAFVHTNDADLELLTDY